MRYEDMFKLSMQVTEDQ